MLNTPELSLPINFFPKIKVLDENTKTFAQEYSVHPSVYSLRKRLIDILGALVGLAITGLLIIPIAIAMQLDNYGPIFYSQTRCGFSYYLSIKLNKHHDEVKPIQ